jgi:hypothetical protein
LLFIITATTITSIITITTITIIVNITTFTIIVNITTITIIVIITITVIVNITTITILVNITTITIIVNITTIIVNITTITILVNITSITTFTIVDVTTGISWSITRNRGSNSTPVGAFLSRWFEARMVGGFASFGYTYSTYALPRATRKRRWITMDFGDHGMHIATNVFETSPIIRRLFERELIV